MACWRCHEPVQGPVCVGCGAVQPPSPEPDLFGILGLPRRFHLDDANIEVAYRAASRNVHPDRHVRASAVERRMALEWMAALNEARRILKDPLRRAAHLALGRVAMGEEKGGLPDSAFLEQIFELRMAGPEDPAVATRIAVLRGGFFAELDACFTAWEAGLGDLSTIPVLLDRLRYLDRTAAEIGI